MLDVVEGRSGKVLQHASDEAADGAKEHENDRVSVKAASGQAAREQVVELRGREDWKVWKSVVW